MASSSISTVTMSKLKAVVRFALSRRSIPILKATIAYLLGIILAFSRRFDNLSDGVPNTLTSMVIMLLIGYPGKAIGASIQAIGFALLGVCIGSVFFVILAELAPSPVAQGFVFAIVVYIFGLVKAQGLKWFSFALLAILVAFNGIYTSVLVGGFSSEYLIGYLKSYCWAAAIVIAVNILIFPTTSERELRSTLRLSLEHIATFAHLIAKTYTLEITEEERAARQHLAQSIRADFGFLVQKVSETSIEVNYSRFSMADYEGFVKRTRGMQLALIAIDSSLTNLEKKDLDIFKTKFLPNTVSSFTSFRKALDTTFREISGELGCKSIDVTADSGYAEFMDIEKQDDQGNPSLQRHLTSHSVDERLNIVSQRLAEELENASNETSTVNETVTTPTRVHTRSASIATSALQTPAPLELPVYAQPNNPAPQNAPAEKSSSTPSRPGSCVRSLRRLFDRFANDQHDILVEALVSGEMHGNDDTLRISDPLPSLQEIYSYKYVPVDLHTGHGKKIKRRRRDWMDTEENASGYATPAKDKADQEVYYEAYRQKTHAEERADEIASASHHSLTRVYSFLFEMEQFVGELEQLYRACKTPSKPRVQFHLFERLHRPHHRSTTPSGNNTAAENDADGNDVNNTDDYELSVAEALALLEHRPYTPVKPNIFQRLETLEKLARSPNSVYAAKSAAAAGIFSVLLLHPVPRPWFLSFGLSSGVLTIMTALTPTLGQSVIAFLLQIAGSGFGYIWALIDFEIFRNVGGFTYNPYGVVCLLIPFSLPLFYIFYEKPQFFVAGLLALNAAGVSLILQWINVEYLKNEHYDTPVIRFAKSFTTLGVALGLVAVFQLFILRNPARSTLRKRVGMLLFSELSYVTLLQAFARGVMPSDDSPRAPDAALARVERELRHRELKIQSELIALRPLVAFAAAEPQLTRPFKEDAINKILRTSQVLLDRMRESRTAIGSQPLPPSVLTNFVRHLSPYRRRNTQILQLSFYLVASSVLSKSPLLRETPTELDSALRRSHFMHDILLLAARHARTEEGERTVRSGDFTRYFHYLVVISSLLQHLKVLEETCKDIFGELEDKLA